MSIEIVTVWAPRPDYDHLRDDYLALMALQRETALWFGYKHTVVTDAKRLTGFDLMQVELPQDVMPAMIAGVVERLKKPIGSHIVFVDADVLIARPLEGAFSASWDLGLTFRQNEKAPINNGAMYVRAGASIVNVRNFFSIALENCGTHWGADQEAISETAAPVPQQYCVETRHGVRVGFLSMKRHNVIPKAIGMFHKSDPFVVHFKGETKEWARDYAHRFILSTFRRNREEVSNGPR